MSYSCKFEEREVLCVYRVEKQKERIKDIFVNSFIIIKPPYLVIGKHHTLQASKNNSPNPIDNRKATMT